MATDEKKAIPDFFIIKREILWSFFACAGYIGVIYKARRLGKTNTGVILKFESEVVTLFYKIKNMIKGHKKFKELEEIDDYVYKGESMGFEKSLYYYNLIIEMLDKRKVLDILKDLQDLGI